MDEILQANIFFFIASVATVIFLILISFILFHVIKIVKSIRSIVDKIEAGSEVLASDVSALRSKIANGGSFITKFISLFINNSGIFGGRERRRRKSSSSRKEKVRDVEEEE